MRRSAFGVTALAGAAVAAALLGQTVLGQPEPAVPVPPPPSAPAVDGVAQPLPDLRTVVDPPPAPQPAAPSLDFKVVSTESLTEGINGIEPKSAKADPGVSVEWVGPTTARLNQPIPCQMVVRNTSAAPVYNVVVRHRLTMGVSCKGSEPQATADNGELSWALGTLAPGQSRRIDVQLVAQTRGGLSCQANVTFTTAATYQVMVKEPLLAVKVRAPKEAVAGESVTLLLGVSNPGDGTTDGVKLKVALPEGLEHSRGRVVEVDVGSLAPKEVKTMQLVCTARTSGVQKCTAVASADGNLSAGDSAQFEILNPRLDLAMTGPKLRYIDRHAVYQLKVQNPGTVPVPSAVLHEVVPAGFKFHAATGGGRYDAGTRTVSWALGDLPPGQARDVTVDLIPTAPGQHALKAQVTSARGVKTDAEARTVVEGLPSLLIELVDVDDPVEVGAETAYEVRVTNTGTKPETNLEVTCTLPDQVELCGAKNGANLRHRVEGRDVIFEPVPRLAPRADVIYRIQVRGKAAGDVRFRTRVRADGLSDPVLREESTRFYSDDLPTRANQ